MTIDMHVNREKQFKDNNVDAITILPYGLFNAQDEEKGTEFPVRVNETLYHTVEKICGWAEDRNITAEGGATSYTQIPKLIEEVYEFRDAETEEEAKLEFGDILVVCIQIARLRGLDMVECLDLAYNKIKNRKGRMIDGRFVKEENL